MKIELRGASLAITAEGRGLLSRQFDNQINRAQSIRDSACREARTSPADNEVPWKKEKRERTGEGKKIRGRRRRARNSLLNAAQHATRRLYASRGAFELDARSKPRDTSAAVDLPTN